MVSMRSWSCPRDPAGKSWATASSPIERTTRAIISSASEVPRSRSIHFMRCVRNVPSLFHQHQARGLDAHGVAVAAGVLEDDHPGVEAAAVLDHFVLPLGSCDPVVGNTIGQLPLRVDDAVVVD